MAGDSFGIPSSLTYPGYAGFSGIVDYNNTTFRVENCSVKAQQNIEPVEDVDGAASHGRFLLAPLTISGDVNFKFDIFSTGSGDGGNGYQAALQFLEDAYGRDSETGNLRARLINRILNVRYHGGFNYEYHGILINTLRMSITAGQAVEISANLKGISRTKNNTAQSKNVESAGMLAPVRVATYNDVQMVLEDNQSDSPSQIFDSSSFLVRDFNMSIDNGVQDIHTLGGRLRPYDLVAGKRKVSGSFKLLSNPGTNALRQYIQDHEKRAVSRLKMTLNLNKGITGFQPFMILPGVVPSLEDVTVTPANVVELSFNYQAFGADNHTSPFQNVTFPDVSEEKGYFPFPDI